MFASIEAAVRTPENYRHVATCTLGDQQDVLEAFQEGEALPRRLGLRPLILGDLMVTDYAVGIVAQGGMRELTGVAVAAYKCRNVPTFSLVAEEPLDQLPPAT